MNWITAQPRPLPASRRELTRTEPVLALPAPMEQRDEPTGPDMRDISPREFAEFTHELYLGGELSWREYRMVGFPSELDPRWDETIGALTGEKAEPDRPRDMLIEWERRVDFMNRYQPGDPNSLLAERIHDVLSRYAGRGKA